MRRSGARTGRRIGTLLLVALLTACVHIEPARAGTQTLGLGGWRVQSSALAGAGGRRISTPGFDASSWLAVSPDDAGAPGSEIAALLQNGACPDVFYAERMRECFGYMSRIGRDTVERFAVPWWWRTDFVAEPSLPGQQELIVNGVVGEAGVWVDGREVAGRAMVQGAYARYVLNLAGLTRPGTNSLAIEVYPNDPDTMLTLDDVDWNQIAPDNNTGIQFPVQLHTSGPLALSDAHVSQQDSPTASSAALTLQGEVTSSAATSMRGLVTAIVTPPPGYGGPITLEQEVTLRPHESREVSFEPAADPALRLSHPAVWWPYQLGAQPLYGLQMSVGAEGSSDSESQSFGIRTVTSELVGRSPMAPDGVRRFSVNGEPVMIRGGGFTEDEFLRYSAAATAAQIALIKNLGLNAIRTEGKEMPQDFYEQMDRAGIMIDAGFQCCDAWQIEGSRRPSLREYAVMERSARTIGEELRDHPSVIDFSWSDDAPTPKQEQVSLRGFQQAGFQDPLISSAEYNSSRVLGPSGEKEGPYDWVPPSYWYDSAHYDPEDPTRTNAGGAWGFDSEASAGDTVPTEDSIERFMSPFEQEQLWREPAFNQYHTNYEAEVPNAHNEGYSFGTLYNLDRAITERYGAPTSLHEYVEEAQVQNYETQRAQFEAYIDHADASPTPSTGVIYWMLNKGMPTLLWDLYNEEYDEAGSFFGAKEANRAVHALFAYDTGAVTLDNLTAETQGPLTLTARVYSLEGKLLDEQSTGAITLAAQQVQTGVLDPKLPPETHPPEPAQTYFVQLLLREGSEAIDRNVYWLSSQRDEIDWPATIGRTYATMDQYADLTALQSLPTGSLSVSASSHAQAGPDGDDMLATVHVTDTSAGTAPDFFIRADLRRGSAVSPSASSDPEVLPALWSENDITLWPGETATLTVAYDSAELDGEAPIVSVGAWNVPLLAVGVRGTRPGSPT
jgi:exo-1,4-beta-D-glucosaminidase